jgi:hypothetical protein
MTPANLDADLDRELVRIVERAVPGARVLRAQRLGVDEGVGNADATAKAAGYGIPIRIDVERDGSARSLVLHGASANPFGHNRRADRAAELILAADTYGLVPRHVRALDVGALKSDGSSISLQDGAEFYLLTDYAPGRPYADDLRRIAKTGTVEPTDVARVKVLVDYLVELHAAPCDDAVGYERAVRDLFGGGEGIFGIVDGYGAGAPGGEVTRLKRLEHLCLDWRWRLKAQRPRPARIHADFHPFNVLFDEQSSLHVLDTSRGSLGDRADDVTCMAVNYVFFALENLASWRGAFAQLWYDFWDLYRRASGDTDLVAVAPPYLAWRLLVLACPAWYPNLAESARSQLLSFAEATLLHDRFEPTLAELVFR